MKHLMTINELFSDNFLKNNFDNFFSKFELEKKDFSYAKDSDDLIESLERELDKILNQIFNNDIENKDAISNNLHYINFFLNSNSLNVNEILSDNSEIFLADPFPIKYSNNLGKIFSSNIDDIDDILDDEIIGFFKKKISKRDVRKLIKSINKSFDTPILEVYKKDLKDFIEDNRDSDLEKYNTLLTIHLITSINFKFLKFLEDDNIEDFKIENKKSNNKIDRKKDLDSDNSHTDVETDIAKNSDVKVYPIKVKSFAGKKESNKKFSRKIENYIKDLHPNSQKRFRYFFEQIENLGYKIILTSGYRDFYKQSELKKKNKKNASPGYSTHNYGLAVDFNLVDSNGKWYKKASSKNDWNSTGVPDLAKSLGFRWGGDFKSYYDPIHFDLGKDYSISKMRKNAILESGQSISEEIDWSIVHGNRVRIV